MMTTPAQELARRLAEPFPPEDIEWRQGAKMGQDALMLPYITARAVFDRLDQVLGLGRWTTEHRTTGRQDSGWICKLSLLVNVGTEAQPEYQWASHEDGADATQIEATKGGCSDSLKRVAVRFGIGRYLYSLPKQWAPLDRTGRPDRNWRPAPFPPEALPRGYMQKVEDPPPRKSAPSAAAPTDVGGRQASAPRRTGPSTDDDPSATLPTSKPPFDLRAPIGFGKYKDDPWAHLARGAPGGRRRGWLEWAEENIDTNKESWRRVHALLEWLRAHENADEAGGGNGADAAMAREAGPDEGYTASPDDDLPF